MKRRHSIAGCTAVLVMSAAGAARAGEESFETQLVKDPAVYALASEDGYLWTFSIQCNDFPPGATQSVDIAAGDPNVVTANPISMAACPWTDFGGGQMGAEFTANFASLRDLGDWDITCNGTHFDPAMCWSSNEGPCHFTCPPEAVTAWANPFTFHIHVFNDAPTANLQISPTPAWNNTITLDCNGSDPDSGAVSYSWSVLTRPPGSTANFSSTTVETPTMSFTSDKEIGDWKVRCSVVDDEAERKSFDKSFTIPNVVTPVSLSGDLAIDATTDIDLTVSPTDDVDGGALDFTWEIVSSPSLGHVADFEDGIGGPEHLVIPTTDADIGTWVIKVVGKDNEGHEESDTVSVEVKNIPPDIDFVGLEEIDVGDSFNVQTTITDDADGGVLTFEWKVIQAPTAGGLSGLVGTDYFLDPYITGADDAGSWIFELTAKDDDGAQVSKQYSVLVDGLPTASISGPAQIDPTHFPLHIAGTASTDPDTDAPHYNVNGPVVGLSPGLEYTWYVIEVPPEFELTIPLGPVDAAFGKNGSGPDLSFGYADLGEGTWSFQLYVVDGEGNPAYADYSVFILPTNTAPIAVATPTQSRYDVANDVTPVDVAVLGGQSYDLDNILGNGTLFEGDGIVAYEWSAIPPAGCPVPNLPPLQTLTLFPAGSTVPAACHGTWQIHLKVSDDDTPQLSGTTDTTFVIGNCPTLLCIDSPLELFPAVVDFIPGTDIIVKYHLDSALYDQPEFMLGMYTELGIYHESDFTTPTFTAFDVNVLASNKGGQLQFKWNGYTDAKTRPLPGMYTVQIVLVDPALTASGWQAVELDAIILAVAEPKLLPTSDRFVDRRALEAGTDTVDVDFEVTGATYDQLIWRIRDVSSAIVREEDVPLPAAGAFHWDGKVIGNLTADPGHYRAELEVMKGGNSLGVSDPWDFTIYRLALDPASGPLPAGSPGLFAYVNDDDDNFNAVSDLTEVAANEDDIVELALAVEPSDLLGFADLSATPAGTLVLWDTAAKNAPIALPKNWDTSVDAVPTSVFVEATGAQKTSLELKFNSEGEDFNPVQLALNLVDVDILEDSNNDHTIGAGDAQRTNLQVALWDGAYDAMNNVNNGSDPANYVEQDGRRFYLRARDPSANADPAVAETIELSIGSLRGNSAVHDDATKETLTETGVSTGEFVSRSQILVTDDFPTPNDANADDEHQAHSGPAAGAPVADDVLGDRNHQAEIDGQIVVSYLPKGAPASHPWSLPVCARNPEERRVVDVHVTVFNEPYQDQPPGSGNGVYDVGEPFVDLSTGAKVFGLAGTRGGAVDAALVNTHIKRATDAWAQACVKVKLTGVTFVDAPVDALGNDILADGVFTMGHAVAGSDENLVLTAYMAGASANVVEVFYTGDIAGAYAISRTPSDLVAGLGDKSFVWMRPVVLTPRILAHELGHCMDNGWDNANPQFVFYPANTTHDDNLVSSYRRVIQATVNNCRTIRAAGAFSATGNLFLHFPP